MTSYLFPQLLQRNLHPSDTLQWPHRRLPQRISPRHPWKWVRSTMSSMYWCCWPCTDVVNASTTTTKNQCEHQQKASRLRGGGAGKVCFSFSTTKQPRHSLTSSLLRSASWVWLHVSCVLVRRTFSWSSLLEAKGVHFFSQSAARSVLVQPLSPYPTHQIINRVAVIALVTSYVSFSHSTALNAQLKLRHKVALAKCAARSARDLIFLTINKGQEDVVLYIFLSLFPYKLLNGWFDNSRA